MTEVSGWTDRLASQDLGEIKPRARKRFFRIDGTPITKPSNEAYVEKARIIRARRKLYELATGNSTPDVKPGGQNG